MGWFGRRPSQESNWQLKNHQHPGWSGWGPRTGQCGHSEVWWHPVIKARYTGVIKKNKEKEAGRGREEGTSQTQERGVPSCRHWDWSPRGAAGWTPRTPEHTKPDLCAHKKRVKPWDRKPSVIFWGRVTVNWGTPSHQQAKVWLVRCTEELNRDLG